jgi:hypothetical protein
MPRFLQILHWVCSSLCPLNTPKFIPTVAPTAHEISFRITHLRNFLRESRSTEHHFIRVRTTLAPSRSGMARIPEPHKSGFLSHCLEIHVILPPKLPSWCRIGGHNASSATTWAPPLPPRSLRDCRRQRWGTQAMQSWCGGCSPWGCSTSPRPLAPPPPEWPVETTVAAWLDLEVPVGEACCWACSYRCGSLDYFQQASIPTPKLKMCAPGQRNMVQ